MFHFCNTAQKMKFPIKDFFSKFDQIRSADLVTFTEEIFNGKLHFLCNVTVEILRERLVLRVFWGKEMKH